MNASAQRIADKLSAALSPSHLEVIDESAGHNVPPGSASHFKVIVVAETFAPLGALERHRRVYQLLDDELKHGGVHALALHTYSPAEWIERQREAAESPPCRGGEPSA